MVERFGYSLDVGKSMESEESKKKEKKEDKIEEESLQEPTGEDLSADSVQKDILDDIKEDIEVSPSDANEIDKSDADELPEQDDEDMPKIDKTSEEVYSEESVSADKIAPIIDDESAQDEDVMDKKEDLDEFEEPMPDEPEPEPEPEPEKPPVPGEEDVKEMVDESFKEQNAKKEVEEERSGFNWWKWGTGIVIILILAVIVYKLGFVGVVDNNPTAAVPADEDIDQELEAFFDDNKIDDEDSVLNVKTESKVDESPITKKVLYEDGSSGVISEEEPAPEEPEVKEKDPDVLLNLLKQGVE